MITKKFIYCWFASVLVMFSLSYLWHGIILTDFERLSYSKSIFIVMLSLAYFGIGFLLTLISQLPLLEKFPVRKGAVLGAALGLLVFLISFVFGISFTTAPFLKYVLVDAIWQMVEQCAGGACIGLVHLYVTEMEKRMV